MTTDEMDRWVKRVKPKWGNHDFLEFVRKNCLLVRPPTWPHKRPMVNIDAYRGIQQFFDKRADIAALPSFGEDPFYKKKRKLIMIHPQYLFGTYALDEDWTV